MNHLENLFKGLFVGSLFAGSFSAFPQVKPNFMLIIADDVSFNDVGCYGNRIVKTPNIDRLAREGAAFTNAFLTASSCSPSRCSIITGRYPHCTGAAELHTPLPPDQIPFPLLLREKNYYTAQAGKWHMGPSAHRAFDRYTDNNGYDNGDGGENNWVKFLKERPKDKPFFFWLASFDAHRPWGADTFKITHDPSKILIPPYLADTPETRRDMASYYNEIGRFDYYIGKVREELEKQGVLDNTLIIVIGDNGRPFPRCKTRVYDSGMQTPFVVFWPKGMKQKGTHPGGLVSSVDIAPTILELAGIDIPSYFQGESFAPILKDSSAEIRTAVFSEHNWHDYEAFERMIRTKDFLYLINERPNLTNCGPADSKTSPSQAALNELRDLGRLTPAQTDVFVVPRPSEELYDVRNDPEQLLNLASVPRYQKKLEEMWGMLKKWQSETRDYVPEHLTPDRFDRETGLPLIRN
jgi:N-sulfoglucosamine sulfohydrolase